MFLFAELVKIKKLNTCMNTQAANKNMAVFSNLTQLEEFSSSNNDHITHIDFLSKASKLTELNLKWCRKLKNIDALKNSPQLKEVDLTDAPITSIAILENKIHLKELDIEGSKVTDLSTLNSSKQLQVLNIAETAITDISSLANCSNLKSLNLSKTKIKDLSPLYNSKYLRRLNKSINIPNEEI
jgi:Leucine-rich repeat (LRR) protein